MPLVDATGLRLVAVPEPFPGLRRSSDLTKVNSPDQSYVVVPGLRKMNPSLLDQLIIEAHYRPGGPGGPMLENPYRDWPPAREGWRGEGAR